MEVPGPNKTCESSKVEMIGRAINREGSFPINIRVESKFGILLDPEIFGYLHNQLDAEFRDGIFHDSICRAIANAVRDMVNGFIDTIRPAFTKEHITK